VLLSEGIPFEQGRQKGLSSKKSIF